MISAVAVLRTVSLIRATHSFVPYNLQSGFEVVLHFGPGIKRNKQQRRPVLDVVYPPASGTLHVIWHAE